MSQTNLNPPRCRMVAGIVGNLAYYESCAQDDDLLIPGIRGVQDAPGWTFRIFRDSPKTGFTHIIVSAPDSENGAMVARLLQDHAEEHHGNSRCVMFSVGVFTPAELEELAAD